MNQPDLEPGDEVLVSLVGLVAAGQFECSADRHKPGLLAWARWLRSVDDAELERETRAAIYDSASVNGFQGNWNHEHFKASACWHEARRRHIAAGHSEDCRARTIYGRAHSRLMRDHGYAPAAAGRCRCEVTDG
ncbi:hypothetical protein ABGB12_13055 [Actinocorallia sp. B10E7]|uniref:hypothetical protein n=1 Tax=Actinocorallia sp. B10E7 TaxID=3153558 RepID=UPI00325D800C